MVTIQAMVVTMLTNKWKNVYKFGLLDVILKKIPLYNFILMFPNKYVCDLLYEHGF